jgi:O-antigen ligase
MPEYSIHQATDLGEPQLAGDWRGLFGHKNMASAVFSFLAFIGLFVRKERAAEGWIIFVLSVVFIIASGGKSSTAIFLATIVISYVAARISNFALWALLVGAPLVGLNLLGIGSVLWPSLASITSALPLDSSFTGRADVWAYALPRTTETPIFGHGFLAFWNTAAMLYGAEQNTEWASTASHAHNAYLDAVLSMGFPGLLLFLAAFVVQPALDIRRALARGEEPELTLMFQQTWMFTLYLSAFESFFFNRAHPNWVTFLFAVFSLHYLARFKITRSADARSPPRSWMA